ncbi:phosphatidate phosphatase PAH1 isoform X2 [Argentina anserina]|uniref:phosphatidate phosphatase PAH1 isoform X2 n=1 Tax=Argentina anserina TaxID=57926 RepID=UPI00217663F8|nr:phosphatidate phosphatase PAH1 isoform X2 [Potentilla anserina]
MNVVGKVGSLISQGVYSVATPFHPFGGAVDVIVVQQQDGTFRSTPWYVRFGKFQGVLKGAEKCVRINVNGIDANFHMYLDNSGEAYFIKEVDLSKGSEADGTDLDDLKREDDDQNAGALDHPRLEHSVSDSAVLNDCGSFGANRLERAESDVDRKFYEFQDDQSSLEGSAELSEYGSSRYDNFDTELLGESQISSPEVILVSVDGHVLTAPISASEQNADNLRLDTPRFNLGPGEETDFCEGNEELSSGENAWAADYISKLDVPRTSIAAGNVHSTRKDNNASGHQFEVCEGKEEQDCQVSSTVSQDRDLQMHSDSEDVSAKKADLNGSCLELTELANRGGKNDVEDEGSSFEAHVSAEKTQETLDAGIIELEKNDGLPASCGSVLPDNNISPDLQVGNESRASEASIDSISMHSVSNDLERKDEQMCVDNSSVHSSVDLEAKDEQISSDIISTHSVSNGFKKKEEQVSIDSVSVHSVSNALVEVDKIETDEERHAAGDECSKSESTEPGSSSPSEITQVCSSHRFEISLCRNELRAGMGVTAAAEAFNARRVSAEDFSSSATAIIKNENLIIRYKDRYFSWEKAAPVVLGIAAFGLNLPLESKDAIPVEQDDTEKPSTPSGRRWRLWAIPFRRVKTLEHTSSNSSNEEEFVDSESSLHNSHVEATLESPQKQFVRTNIPTTEQIASLNLKEGQNVITFSFSTRVLGPQQVYAHIYLWKWNARIVISDVDGTITKSDVLGQFMPLVGKDWTQSGVARLFSAIKENGYQLLFLSARAIIQAYLTRSFLNNLKQDGKALPSGPVVISPDGLFPSLFREVVRRAPHEFKIACLEDIKKLFPKDYNPFYAGFGNRDTDELSYRKIGIPKGKIFIINPKGEVAISHHRAGDVKSYTSLHTLVNDMFPPTSLVEQEDFNSWNYWKLPLPEVDLQ